MSGVIYADVLFVINVYITYAMLMLSAFFLGIEPKRLRLLASAIIGGLSSLFILIPNVSTVFLGFLRAVLCLVFCLTAFSFRGIRQLLRQIVTFLTVNFLLAGLMFAIWYFVTPSAVYYNTGIVYIDIDTLSLVLITAVCYFLIKLFGIFAKLKAPKNSLYDVTVRIGDDEFQLRGFLDTGNSLKDPFTSMDVIVVSRSALGEYFPEGKAVSEIIETSPLKIRYLPCATVAGNKLLPAFKAEKVGIKGISASFTVDSVMIAVCDENIRNGEFQALLPESIFQNNYSDKGEDYEKGKRFFTQSNI
ncbi:MAG: sigma-E processing peptidase SpoIIGA [Clostridia bacterium]|nr:sigma-E processing peptidase SpoIIGA [Clostridia bacterium]